jgi:hypothetical protein
MNIDIKKEYCTDKVLVIKKNDVTKYNFYKCEEINKVLKCSIDKTQSQDSDRNVNYICNKWKNFVQQEKKKIFKVERNHLDVICANNTIIEGLTYKHAYFMHVIDKIHNIYKSIQNVYEYKTLDNYNNNKPEDNLIYNSDMTHILKKNTQCSWNDHEFTCLLYVGDNKAISYGSGILYNELIQKYKSDDYIVLMRRNSSEVDNAVSHRFYIGYIPKIKKIISENSDIYININKVYQKLIEVHRNSDKIHTKFDENILPVIKSPIQNVYQIFIAMMQVGALFHPTGQGNYTDKAPVTDDLKKILEDYKNELKYIWDIFITMYGGGGGGATTYEKYQITPKIDLLSYDELIKKNKNNIKALNALKKIETVYTEILKVLNNKKNQVGGNIYYKKYIKYKTKYLKLLKNNN